MQIMPKIKSFLDNSRHILNISYKPSNEEFNRTAKIVILGIIVIGFIGFIISLIVAAITGATI